MEAAAPSANSCLCAPSLRVQRHRCSRPS